VNGEPLSAAERAVLEAVLERLIPADEHGPGALEAGVAGHVERALADEHRRHRDAYAHGLAALAAAARAAHGEPFERLSAERRDALLAAAERDAAGDGFFELVRAHAIEGFFGDPSAGGAAGGAGWRLLGYPGPRREWSAADQALGAAP